MPPQPNLNFDDLIQILQEFLEVAIHYILYIRAVYPQELFDQYKKYNVPVWKSRHPKLSSYVAQVVRACMQEIKQGNVQRLIIALKDAATLEVLEHFIVGLTWLKPSHWFSDAEIRRKYDSGLNMLDIELKLRAFLLKMSTLDAQLSELPEDITFSVFVEISEDGHAPLNPDPHSDEPAPWLPASMDDAKVVAPHAHVAEDGQPKSTPLDPNARLHALKRTKLGMIDLEMEVEESQTKWEYLQRKLAREPMDSENVGSPHRKPTHTDIKGKGRALD